METKGSVIHWAWFYDTLVNILALGKGRAIREQTAGLADIQPGGNVLDVGCGTGDLTLAAARRAGPAGAVRGIDASPEMIEVARRKAARAGATVDFQPGLVEALAFPDNSFDVVLSSLMMHHLPIDLKRRALAEIRRVLKPGGRLVVVDLKRPTGHGGRFALTVLMHGGLQVGVQELAVLMREAGLEDVETGDLKVPLLGFARGRAN
jgi:ubiquinone/menaquinone biosynthesis C-methylase UbiE